MTLVTVCLGNYSRATAWCKVFGNEITNAGFLLPVLTYIFSSHMLLTEKKWKASYKKELTGDLYCELQR